MLVLNLMNSNENWREVLSNAPYNIIIKEEDGYVLLKYNQLNSDFSNPIVRECRGSIFRQENGKWICACRAFDKFGNYGEGYVPTIEWESARVLEKIDGSLMKLWFDKGMWHLSTNRTIHAFAAPLGDFDITFGDYFVECLNCSFNEFTMMLDEDYCYMFEMVGPKNRVVIGYSEAKLYGLGKRNMKTMEEEEYDEPCGKWCNVWLPQRYDLKNLDEVIKVAAALTKDEEGFVVNDRFFHRVKVKSPEYLMAAHLNNNGAITRKRMMEIFLEEKQDDFLAYCPQYKDEFEKLTVQFTSLLKEMYKKLHEFFEHESHYKAMSKKEFAEIALKNKYKDYLFKWYDDKEDLVFNYLRRQRPDVLLKMIDELEQN